MADEVSKTQIDRLGDRLRKSNISETDLRLLDTYRRSFTDAYEIVVSTIRKELAVEPTGRPAKSTTSISEKLRRESIRLTQIQDIAGCRVIVPDIATQDSVVQSLNSLFDEVTIVDRRQQPSHGYRAVHVIVIYGGKLIEIQVRTSLQHLWAELSEKFSDVAGQAIKYGGGDEEIQEALRALFLAVSKMESLEIQLAELQVSLSSQNKLTSTKRKEIVGVIVEVQASFNSLRQETFKVFSDAIKEIEKIKGDKNALSD